MDKKDDNCKINHLKDFGMIFVSFDVLKWDCEFRRWVCGVFRLYGWY